jgi:hypothetical protein
MMIWRMFAKAARHSYREDEEKAYIAGFKDAWNDDPFGFASYSKTMWPKAYADGYHEGSVDKTISEMTIDEVQKGGTI